MAKKISKYARLQKAVSKRCKSPTTSNKEGVKKAKATYIKDAIKKGKTPTEARKIASKADTCKPFKKRKK